MNRPRGASVELRVHFMAFVILCLAGALVARLWWVQVARGEMYTRKIGGRSQVTVRIPSVRGEIRDRNGITLVTNRASYEVDFYLPDMERGFRQRAKELGQPMPIHPYQAPIKGMLKNMQEPDIIKIVNTAVIPRLEDLDLAKDYNAKRLQTHFHINKEVPFTYLEDIDFATIAKFSEHDVGLPGVDISIKPVREYLYGALAAHLLGYVGMPQDLNKLPDIGDYIFYQADFEGKSNIELSMDKYLRGSPGVRVMQRNVKGVIEGELRVDPPKPGNNVYLTLDARMQMIAEKSLRHPALGRAAAVVVDPNNGDILAMASIPSFDPNIFIPSVSTEDWKELNDDEAVPLVNRAVSGFPPGSTFKIVTSLAGLRKGLGGSHYNCSGGVQYGNHFFHCWIAEKGGGHGTIGLADAIKMSCDSYFYQYGNAAGIDSIDLVGNLLGIGQKSDIGLLDEKEGCLPGPEWMKMKYPNEHWSTAYTANVSIGQGYVLASPLQIAMAYATVANGGISYAPRLVDQVLTPDGKPALDEAGNPAWPREPKVRADLRSEIKPEQIEAVRRGLWKVVNETGGTGAKAKIKGVIVAGKTGTAQATELGKKEHIAWFACFAPYDHPKYVVVSMVQGGEHGGGVAAPIAARILDQILAMDQGTYAPELVRLEPAHNDHPFQRIDALDYKEASIAITPDDESTDASEPAGKAQMGRSNASPDIRPDADAQGRVKPRGQKPKQPQTQQTQSPPQAPPPDRRSIFEKFFHPNKSPQQKATPPAQDPRRPH